MGTVLRGGQEDPLGPWGGSSGVLGGGCSGISGRVLEDPRGGSSGILGEPPQGSLGGSSGIFRDPRGGSSGCLGCPQVSSRSVLRDSGGVSAESSGYPGSGIVGEAPRGFSARVLRDPLGGSSGIPQECLQGSIRRMPAHNVARYAVELNFGLRPCFCVS